MKTTKVYDVEIGFVVEGEDEGNWSRRRVLAKTADEAIQKARKRFKKGEYARAVKEICDLEDAS